MAKQILFKSKVVRISVTGMRSQIYLVMNLTFDKALKRKCEENWSVIVSINEIKSQQRENLDLQAVPITIDT